MLVFGILGLVTPGVGALAFYKSSAVILVIYLISIIIVAIVETALGMVIITGAGFTVVRAFVVGLGWLEVVSIVAESAIILLF
ncbi:unnamed protein product [Hymenolepis diminuta]|uniref:Uncharacterized protein n=1 Tax=Hymenolepis diminuta TaxID=6216 RepID=A0A3P6ZRA4_HYMDI|nr:unnamed protein product [Hymenolepis diminuta]